MQIDDASCLLCGEKATGTTYPFGTRWDGQQFDYLRCGGCKASFLHPLPTDEQFGRMYDHAHYHEQFYEEGADASFLPEVLSDLRRGGSLLDFGCGNGGFLRIATENGFDSTGVELEESARVSAAALSGCPVLSLEELFREGRRFDVIHLADVLEHLPDPTATMRQLELLLADGGRFFLEGPIEDNPSPVVWASSLFGLAKRAAGRPLHGDLPPFHLFRTNATTQRTYFEDRLGYRLHRYFVGETGWPYWNEGDRFLRPRGAGHFVRMAIGKVAIGAAAIGRPVGLRLGNRFAAVASPR